MNTFASQAAARKYIAENGLKYDGGRGDTSYVMIKGYMINGVEEYRIEQITEISAPAFQPRLVDKVPGATRKMSLTDRAVAAFIKGMDRDAIVAELVKYGSKPESARCTAHFVVTGKVSKAHAAMIAAGKWVGYAQRAA